MVWVMLPLERLIRAFRGEETDTLPWFADLTYWYSAQEKMGRLPEKYLGRGRISLYKELGCGAHEELYGSVVKTTYEGVKVKRWREETSDGRIIEKVEYHTPLGILKGYRKYSPVSFSWAWVEHPVKTVEDLKKLKYIYENLKVEADEAAYDRQERLMKEWDGWGLVSSLPPRSPFARLLIQWAGAMNTFRLYWKAREELDEVIQVMGESDDPIYEAIAEAPADFVYFGENISSDMVGPKIFNEYYAPYYRRRVRELHAKKKLIYVHIDGRLKGVLPLLRETGVDCAQSLTPAPVGDVPLEDFRKLAGPGITLWGGLPGVYFSPVYPEHLLKEMVYRILDVYGNDKRFIVGVADQVPPDGDIKRVRLVTEILENR